MSKDARPEFRDPTPPNTCYAKGCGEPISPRYLMCWGHWRRVPRRIQATIWESNYVVHPEHAASRLAARASIAAKEGIVLDEDERRALETYGLNPDGHPAAQRRL